MRRLLQRVAHARQEYLSRFPASTLLPPAASAAGNLQGSAPTPTVPRALAQRLAARLLSVYVRHASLLRPVSHAGALQLAKDAGELEAAAAQQLAPLDALQAPVGRLRAFRRALFMDAAALGAGAAAAAAGGGKGVAGGKAAGPQAGELPPSVVLHLLFSRAPAAVASPHARQGLTPAQYSLWLDDHSEAEALAFIAAAVMAGEAALKQRGQGEDATLAAMRMVLQAHAPPTGA
uniref:Uncharacterized protein n=2 Tax=Auxenochlorella protothecoides TaxID=3075 RepID=A0A1D2AB00_AUXPR